MQSYRHGRRLLRSSFCVSAKQAILVATKAHRACIRLPESRENNAKSLGYTAFPRCQRVRLTPIYIRSAKLVRVIEETSTFESNVARASAKENSREHRLDNRRAIVRTRTQLEKVCRAQFTFFLSSSSNCDISQITDVRPNSLDFLNLLYILNAGYPTRR